MNADMNLPRPVDGQPEYPDGEPERERLEDIAVDRIKPRQVANLLLWLVLGFFAIFFLWASLAQIDRSVHATGRIVPDSRLQVVSNLEGGIVSEILVSSGDNVRRGQALIRLDRTQRDAEFGSSASNAQALQAKIARLQGQLSGRAPSYESDGSASAAEAIEIEQALYAAEMAELSSLIQSGEARINQSVRSVSEAEANYQASLAQLRNYEDQIEVMRPLVNRGIEPRLTLVQLENQAAAARAQSTSSSATISRATANVAEARSALRQARDDWRARVATELAESRARLASLRETLPALQDRVDRSVVTAPLAGTVNRVLVNTVGGSIGAGAPLVEIVPTGESLMFEARLLPKDIGFVRIGQDARISITAYQSNIYGSLDGEVIAISPDATTDQETGQSFYVVQVRSDQELTSPSGQKLPLGVGMTADISILGERRSVLAYLISPFSRLRERALRE